MDVAEQIDKEIEAIKVILRLLDPLTPEVRSSVLGYVLRRLQIPVEQIQNTAISSLLAPNAATAPPFGRRCGRASGDANTHQGS